jgi:hypothetical protein
LAYIKPATQSESTQLIQLFCEKYGIDCQPIGPLVYYRGFTRAFLAGETGTGESLLAKCARAVDRLARGKDVVLVDGVGFPAVGSICQTDNASVAKACSYPTQDGGRKPMGVVLVGGSGVGAAVDGFNLNATYFESKNVPVIGAIFNKLSETGFYSLENCRKEVTKYFEQSDEQLTKRRSPFGFVPLFPDIAGKQAMDHVEDFVRLFGEYVNIEAIVKAATECKLSVSSTESQLNRNGLYPAKRRKVDGPTNLLPARTREEIERQAIGAGAAPSA